VVDMCVLFCDRWKTQLNHASRPLSRALRFAERSRRVGMKIVRRCGGNVSRETFCSGRKNAGSRKLPGMKFVGKRLRVACLSFALHLFPTSFHLPMRGGGGVGQAKKGKGSKGETCSLEAREASGKRAGEGGGKRGSLACRRGRT